jgi:hypothetical protein
MNFLSYNYTESSLTLSFDLMQIVCRAEGENNWRFLAGIKNKLQKTIIKYLNNIRLYKCHIFISIFNSKIYHSISTKFHKFNINKS